MNLRALFFLRYHNAERRAFARLTFGGDTAAMRFDNSSDHRKAKTDAAFFIRIGRAFVEDRLQTLRRNAAAGISDPALQRVASSGLDADHDLTARRILDRVR